VFRSLVKETRITPATVEFEMYVRPTQNVWWKYRQKAMRRNTSHNRGGTLRIGIPQATRPDNCIYTTSQAAKILGISPDLLRWRIRVGKYTDAPRGNGDRRLFTSEHIQTIRRLQVKR
jgi:hypothetical protein